MRQRRSHHVLNQIDLALFNEAVDQLVDPLLQCAAMDLDSFRREMRVEDAADLGVQRGIEVDWQQFLIELGKARAICGGESAKIPHHALHQIIGRCEVKAAMAVGVRNRAAGAHAGVGIERLLCLIMAIMIEIHIWHRCLRNARHKPDSSHPQASPVLFIKRLITFVGKAAIWACEN